ncbi:MULTISPECIES: hypothetical protein [unclassified Bradyrhizobium]|uniref:hypothetical protein n=1 Tax=unclassified Bradyrhizobium TaxID=2631580 RepID=UPI0033968183
MKVPVTIGGTVFEFEYTDASKIELMVMPAEKHTMENEISTTMTLDQLETFGSIIGGIIKHMRHKGVAN